MRWDGLIELVSGRNDSPPPSWNPPIPADGPSQMSRHAVSGDGRYVVFTANAPSIAGYYGPSLYLRDRRLSDTRMLFAGVDSVKLAKSAQKHGADAVVATGFEAAGHSGDVTTFVLIPRLREAIDIPIIAAGGIGNGAGIVGALALGASGVWMGTRFLYTKESPMHDNFKQKGVELDVTDTVSSDKFDGIPCRQMITPRTLEIVNARVGLNPLRVFLESFGVARELQSPYLKLFTDVLKKGPKETIAMMRMAQMLQAHTVTLTTGDMKTGMTASGQSVGLIHDVPTVAEVMQRLLAEVEDARTRLAASLAA